MFLKEVSNAQQDCVYLIKNTIKTVIPWNILRIFNCNIIFFIFIYCIINGEKSCTSYYVCRNSDKKIRILWWIESWKEQHLFKIETFHIVINVFTDTYEQCSASFLAEYNNLLIDPKLLNSSVYTHILLNSTLRSNS